MRDFNATLEAYVTHIMTVGNRMKEESIARAMAASNVRLIDIQRGRVTGRLVIENHPVCNAGGIIIPEIGSREPFRFCSCFRIELRTNSGDLICQAVPTKDGLSTTHDISGVERRIDLR